MPQRIVIIGAGFAGTWSALAARQLISSHIKNIPAATDIEVIVIAPDDQLVMRPRLYEADPASLAAPLAELFKTTGVGFVRGTVDAIHPIKREVEVVDPEGDRSTMSYDRLILAAGSRLVRPDIPGLHEHAFSVDQMEDATKLDRHLHHLSSLPPTDARNTIVVCGAGFTGIELAAELPSRVRSILGQDTKARIILVGRDREVGSTLGPGPRPVIEKALAHLNVEIKLGTTITAIDAGGVMTAEGERIEALTTIWTAGVAATSLTQQLPGDKDQFGRLYVDANLRLPSTNEIFVTGDAACAMADKSGHEALMSCQHALVLGRISGNNAAADLLSIPRKPYSQPVYVTCLDLGEYGAVLSTGWARHVVFSGSLAKRVKRFINQTLIYPPDSKNPKKALAAADPTVVSGFAATVSQGVMSIVFSVIALLRRILVKITKSDKRNKE